MEKPNSNTVYEKKPNQELQSDRFFNDKVKCQTSESLNRLNEDYKSQKNKLINGGYLNQSSIATEKCKKPKISEILSDCQLDHINKIWLNGDECYRGKDGKFYYSKNNKTTKIYPGDSLSFEPSTNSCVQNEKKENPDLLRLQELMEKEFSEMLKDPNKLEKFISEIWDPQKNPELCAQQHCTDTLIRILEYFCKKSKIDFGVKLGKPAKIYKVSDFKNSKEFFHYIFPKFSGSNIYGGNAGVFKEVCKINQSNCNNSDIASLIKPGDIICIKHKGGGYHNQMCLNSSSDIRKLKFISGEQYYRDLMDDKGKFNPISENIGKELSDYPKGFIRDGNFNKYGGFGGKPYIQERTLLDRLEDGDTIKIMRFNPIGLNPKNRIT